MIKWFALLLPQTMARFLCFAGYQLPNMFPRRFYDKLFFCIGVLLLLGPIILFAIKIIPKSWKLSFISQFFSILSVLLSIAALILMILTRVIEPGYLPKNTDIEPLHSVQPHPRSDNVNGTENSSAAYPFASAPPSTMYGLTRFEVVNGFSFECKYCTTCLLWRHSRDFHCHYCNRCVSKHDHHCPWMGGCVGERNYRFFVLFCVMCSLLCVSVITSCFLTIVNADDISAEPVSLFILVYAFLMEWTLISLSVYHLWLIWKGITTHEHIKYNSNPTQLKLIRNAFRNPTCWGNVVDIFFSAIPQSRESWIYPSHAATT